jgi:hypothetical protein
MSLKGYAMKNYFKKYLFETNKLFFNLFFISMCIAAITISLKWNKFTDSYWGIIYLILALAVIITGKQNVFPKEEVKD